MLSGMADYTDFIRIRGLESSDDEVFQGLGAASLSVESGVQPGVSESSNWIETMLIDASGAFADILSFITGKAPDVGVVEEGEEEGARSLGLSRGFGALVPYVGGALALTANLPPAAAGFATIMAVVHVIDDILEDVEDVFDPLDPGWRLYAIEKKLKSIDDHLKTGLIWEDGILGIDKSILGTALLQLSEEEKSILKERLTALIAELMNTTSAVEDLTFIDSEVKYADNTSLHTKGKVLHH